MSIIILALLTDIINTMGVVPLHACLLFTRSVSHTPLLHVYTFPVTTHFLVTFFLTLHLTTHYISAYSTPHPQLWSSCVYPLGILGKQKVNTCKSTTIWNYITIQWGLFQHSTITSHTHVHVHACILMSHSLMGGWITARKTGPGASESGRGLLA